MEVQDQLLTLFDSLLAVTHKGKNSCDSSTLIFDLLNMTQNNRSKLLSKSGLWIDSEASQYLIQQGLIQNVLSEEKEKFALTFKGIAESIKLRFSIKFEEQLQNLLEQCDQKFNTDQQTRLTWKEKLATISLLLVLSTSATSEIRLDIEANKAVMTEVFEKILDCLKKYKIILNEETLIATSGEHPATAIMRRVNDLTRKTNLYYMNDRTATGYYFDIEERNDLSETRFSFLLKRVFEFYDPKCNYSDLYNELANISQLYTPKFLARSVNQMVAFSTLRRLKNFLEMDILRLPSVQPTF